MKIILFGSSGQVAEEVIRRAPDDVVIKSLSREDADFSSPDAVQRIALSVEADAFINAVAYTAVDDAENDEHIANAINNISVAKLAEAASTRSIPLVHISTDYVFDGSGTTPRASTAPTGPLNVYGRTKLAGEMALVASGAKYIILRTSWVFSAFGNNFVKTMVRVGQDRSTLNVVSDQIGGPTPAAAIADAAIKAAVYLTEGFPSGTYHFSGTPDVSWADFAREVFFQSNMDVDVLDIPTSSYPTPAKRPLNSRLNCRATKDDLGIDRPMWKTHLTDVLKELAAK